MSVKQIVLLAAVMGALGVGLGAFGAHGLAAVFEANPGNEATYDTAVLYHLVHAVALLGAAWLRERYPNRWTSLAPILFGIGMILFSGALYLLSVANLRFMGAVAPLGGAAFIAGWLCLGIGAWRAE